MAKDSKYGNVDIPGIPSEEPVFVLRARDALALPTILHYQGMVEGLHRLDDSMALGLRKAIHAFGNYTGLRKLPD